MCALALLFLLPSPWSPCPFFSQGASLLNRIGASTSTPRRRLDLGSGGPKPWASGAWRSDGRLSMGSGTVFLSARARASIGQTRRCVDAPQCHPNADADRRMQTVLTHRLRLQAGVRACLARLAHGVARAHGRPRSSSSTCHEAHKVAVTVITCTLSAGGDGAHASSSTLFASAPKVCGGRG